MNPSGRRSLTPVTPSEAGSRELRGVDLCLAAIATRRAHVDVDGGVAGLVQTSGYTADDHELDAMLGEHAAYGDDVIVVELRLRH